MDIVSVTYDQAMSLSNRESHRFIRAAVDAAGVDYDVFADEFEEFTPLWEVVEAAFFLGFDLLSM